MNLLKNIYFKVPPKPLYHYTGIGSLTSIVEKGCLWASHIYYLNDSAEIIYARDILKKVSKKLDLMDITAAEEFRFLNPFCDWLDTFSNNAYHLFVFSLTEEPNLLSQWRSYTPHGKGVSIGFSCELVQEIIQDHNFKLTKCIYGKAEQEKIVSGFLKKMCAEYKKELTISKLSKPLNRNLFMFFEKFRGDILQLLSVIKHPAFKEEREWRIISKYYDKYTVPEIKFREGASMLVPYIEIKIGQNNGEQPLFEKVYLGPSQHVNLSMSALSSFLSNKGVCNQTVNSQIPYREWA